MALNLRHGYRMTALSMRHNFPSRATPHRRERLGVPFLLVLVWLVFEFVRPPTPPGLPLLLSAVLFGQWVFLRDKQWGRQGVWWLVLLAVVASGIVFAENTYAVFVNTRLMAALVLGSCLPLQALTSSVRRLQTWVTTFLAIAVVVGGWAAFHGGFGPAGTDGGQDENYVAALMGMAVPFAYFSLFLERRWTPRLLYAGAIVVFVAAIALGANPSRGGFLGLIAVSIYCVLRSPRKVLGFSLLGAMGLALLLLAGPAFWAEIGTTTDVTSGTADVRLEVWKAGFRMWLGNPFLGVGAGNFRWVIGEYQSAEQFLKFGRSLGGSIIAHSLPVELLAELGLAGVIATGALIVITWRGLGDVRRSAHEDAVGSGRPNDVQRIGLYADALRASLLAVLVNGVFLSLLYYAHLWILLAIGGALPFIYRKTLGDRPQRPGVAGWTPAVRGWGRPRSNASRSPVQWPEAKMMPAVESR